MTWVVPSALGGVAILVMVVFTMLSARKRHRAIVAPAITAGPRILVHDINDDRCTGCDACVAVCPTNVLDLVANKSRVIAFHECIQCEQCMFACPTEALVMFPQGGTPPSLKVPEIDENFQTAVVGQYLIGEVAGKPLVKNAANLGRAVIEHMLQTGLQPGALGGGDNAVDVAIVGSGPGGLSAALTCLQKGLSYVVLEKEQMIASTISRYPKGKLVMAEPYDTQNMSLLPVFDSGKEQLIPIWAEVIERVGLKIKQGESVETVARGGDGVFDVRTTVASYRAQRMVLSIGTRGKPRTLQVPGENLPKIYSLLEDPDEWRGKSVLVCGGGDSACEAALALADAGAKVMISYRGKGFNRAAPKNKSAIEGYASQGRIKAKLGSQIINFEADTVTLQLNDGSQKLYPNDAAFVLIGADPPISWLEKMGVRFVERPHQYQLGKTDDIVRRFVPRAVECPEDAARAAAQVLGGSIGVEPPRPTAEATAAAAAELGMMPLGEPVSGPRKWLRSATSIFSNRPGTNTGMNPMAGAPVRPDARAQRAKRLDGPMPLSEFAKRSKPSHSGHGRRDSLSAGERTRILRMLRDEGGRLADEESQVLLGSGGPDYDFDFDDSPPPSANMLRPDVPAKPAVVVGIAQAQAARNGKRDKASAPMMAAQLPADAQGAMVPQAAMPSQPYQMPPPYALASPQHAMAEPYGMPSQQHGMPSQQHAMAEPYALASPQHAMAEPYAMASPQHAMAEPYAMAPQHAMAPQPYAMPPQPYPMAADPNGMPPQPYPMAADANAMTSQPYAMPPQPYAMAQQSHEQPQHHAMAPQPYPMAPQPYPMAPEPYAMGQQPYPMAPEAYPMGQQPYPMAPPHLAPEPQHLAPEPHAMAPQHLAPEPHVPPPLALPPEHLAPEPHAPPPLYSMTSPSSLAPLTLPAVETEDLDIQQPRSTKSQPRPSAQQPRPSAQQPRPTAQKPRPTAAQPRPTAAQPRTTSPHPRTTTHQVQAEPRPSAEQPRPAADARPAKPASRPTMKPPSYPVVQPPPEQVVSPPSRPPPTQGARRGPAPFGDEPTRQLDDQLLSALRNAPPAKPSPSASAKPVRAMHDEPTRMAIDVSAQRAADLAPPRPITGGPSRTVEVSFSDEHGEEDMTRPVDDFPRLRDPAPAADAPAIPPFAGFEDHREGDDATKLASVEGLAALERARNQGKSNDESTRAVNIRNDPSIADIDWDLD